LLLTACAHHQQAQLPAPVAGKPITTEADAIAVVLADIHGHGGDPAERNVEEQIESIL